MPIPVSHSPRPEVTVYHDNTTEFPQAQALVASGIEIDSIQLVDWSERLRFGLRYGGRVHAHQPYPCPDCGAAVVALRLIGDPLVRICNAEEQLGTWIANLFDLHLCSEVQL